MSDNDAEVVTYKILTDKGKVIHRADAMPLTEEEKKKEGSPEMKLLAEYDKKIDSYVNEATVSFREDVKFADEGTADVHPSDTTRTFLNIIDNLDLEEQDPEAVDPSKLGHEKQFEDFDNVTPEAYDENLKKLIKLNNNGEEVLGKVVSRKRNSDGKLIGKHNIDPKLDSRIYWLEMQDGGMAEVTTNFIVWQQHLVP